jgi:ABC-type dipeptide/oligopeptide/nickel transport system ATPase component
VLANPSHAYTAALVRAAQATRNAEGQFATIEGAFSTTQD